FCRLRCGRSIRRSRQFQLQTKHRAALRPDFSRGVEKTRAVAGKARDRFSRGCGWRLRSSSSLAWIEVLAESIADEVECKHRKRDGDAGEDQRMRRGLQCRQIASFFNHYSPRWRGWRYAEAEERQRRLG